MAINKMQIRDQYYDQVMCKQIHSQFLMPTTKSVVGIPTKTIPVMPVDSE